MHLSQIIFRTCDFYAFWEHYLKLIVRSIST